MVDCVTGVTDYKITMKAEQRPPWIQDIKDVTCLMASYLVTL